MIKIDSGIIIFTIGFSLEQKADGGYQITVGQLIEKHIVMTISKVMIMYIGIMSDTSRLTPASIYYYYSTH